MPVSAGWRSAAEWRLGHQRRHEALRFRRPRHLLVLVEDEPSVSGPGFEILTDDLREGLDVLPSRRDGAQVLAQPYVAAFDQSRASTRDAEREGGDIRRRRS